MRKNTSQRKSSAKKGCLFRLLFFVFSVGFFYWLFLSPTNPPYPTINSDNAVLDGKLNNVQAEALGVLNEESTTSLQTLAPNGQIQYISTTITVPDTIAITYPEKALYFIKQNNNLFQIGDVGKELRYQDQHTDYLGVTHVKYTQQYQGVPIYNSNFSVEINGENEVIAFNANYVPNLNVSVYPSVRSVDAKVLAIQDLGLDDAENLQNTYLEIYAPELWGEETVEPKLAWFVPIFSSYLNESWVYVIDAQDGKILNIFNSILEQGGKIDLEIWDSNTDMLVMDEDGETELPNNEISIVNKDARDAFDNIKIVYDYFLEKHKRDSYDKVGGTIRIYVNNDTVRKAQWNPNNQAIYIEKTWATGIDVLAHEFTHGVVQHTAKLGGGESRALNEAYADIFAAFIDTKEPWIISRIPNATGDDIRRNISNPASYYPTNYVDIYCDREDPQCKHKCFPESIDSYSDCGHVNSLIFSHAAFLAANNGVLITKLEQIYYYALTEGLFPSSTMKQAALVTLGACTRLEGEGKYDIITNDCEKIRQAFITTGLIPFPDPTPSLQPIDDWLANIQEAARAWLDNIIGDIRIKVEDYLQELYNQLIDILKDGLESFIDALLQKVLEFIVNTLENFCLGTAFSALFPIALIAWRTKKT